MIMDVVLVRWIDAVFVFYCALVYGAYFLLLGFSIWAVWRYKRKNRLVEDGVLLVSNALAPKMSILAPVYNEELWIEHAVRTMLLQRYAAYEVIVINDGSTDGTLEKLCTSFLLEPVSFYVDPQLDTKPIRTVYRSTSPLYHRLVVVDKENGGKADALNAGLNVSTGLYVLCIDGDGILAPDTLLKLGRQVLLGTNQLVAAVGGGIGVANGCRFHNGSLVENRLSGNFFVNVQILEYMRAFVVARMGWSAINGVTLISGALGCFRRDVLIHVGGYSRDFLGEDIDVVLRMRRYLYDHGIDHVVRYIPEPLLWTEVPSTLGVLQRQRTRWARGLTQALWTHKVFMLNPKYKVVGLIAFPYLFFVEFLAVFIEVFGLFYVVFLIFSGLFVWERYAFLCFFMAVSGILISFLALFLDYQTRPRFTRVRDMALLFFCPFFEVLFGYHFLTVYYSLKGNWLLFWGHKDWGVMTRKGAG